MESELKIFSMIAGDLRVIFDVGAKEDLTYYHMQPRADYHLFEPNSVFVETLRKKAAALGNPQNIKINAFGLSDKNADNCTYYEKSQSFILNPTLTEKNEREHAYSLRTLDDYVSTYKISHIDFLKIDTEGLDYTIIQGGLETIKDKVSYIQFEYWDGVKKFSDLLGDSFTLFLVLEPALIKAIASNNRRLTKEQRDIDYSAAALLLDEKAIDLIDRVLIPMEYGGNIFGVSKKVPSGQSAKILSALQKVPTGE